MGLRAQRGFTLLEVVVAFVVLALVLATVFQIFSAGLSRTADLDEYSRALVIAQSRLAAANVEEGVKEGQVRGETPDRRFEWTVTTAAHQDASITGTNAAVPAAPQATFGLYRVDVKVGWKGADGKDRQVALASLQLGPPPR